MQIPIFQSVVEFRSRQFDLVENEEDIFVHNFDKFVAGSFYGNAAMWPRITADSRVFDWIQKRFDIKHFSQHL